jgi:hypothetical protein
LEKVLWSPLEHRRNITHILQHTIEEIRFSQNIIVFYVGTVTEYDVSSLLSVCREHSPIYIGPKLNISLPVTNVRIADTFSRNRQ